MSTTCFISYSWDSQEHKAWVEQLAQTLQTFGVNVVYDQDRDSNPMGGDISTFFRDSIQKSDFIVVIVTPKYIEKANEPRGYVGQETTLIQSRLENYQCRLVVPVLRSGTELPRYLYTKHYIDMRDDRQYAGQATVLLRTMNALGSGIALRDAVFDEENPLPDKVFAIELLQMPVWVRKQKGRTSVSISRIGAELGVYTVEGRERIVDMTLSDKAEAAQEAKRLDKEIHNILLGNLNPQSYKIDQPNLRWASGGVLSRVWYNKRRWFSFFFRDIPPFGWNISLGGSEHEDEMTDPMKFIMREFIEETLVCRTGNAGQMIQRPFAGPGPLLSDPRALENAIKRANEFSAKHRRLRFECDGLVFQSAPGAPVLYDPLPTKTDIDIDGCQPMRSVLICINVAELGIEVIKVLTYELDDNDFLLDGEIFEPAEKSQVELVRMPVALISEDYLRDAFAGKDTFVYDSPFEAKLPSIKGPPIPPSEIVIFPHDVRRRVECTKAPPGQATDWERNQYTLWKERFGKNFLDQSEAPTNTNASVLFTPSSVKAVVYYFANM